MAVVAISRYTWPNDPINILGLTISLEDLAARIQVPIASWNEDGLGPVRGFGCRLPSGRVILVEEFEIAVRHGYVPGPSVLIDVGEVAHHGVDILVGGILTALSLTQADCVCPEKEIIQDLANQRVAEVGEWRERCPGL